MSSKQIENFWTKNWNKTIEIKKISNVGEVYLNFSQEIIIFEKELINDNLKIEIIPSNPDTDTSLFELSFECVEMVTTYMKL